MRPLRLKLKNFTAFRDEQEMDFTELDLFALWGPIGSGKSSVLDAMTYALYGRVERVGDEPKHLVSQGQPRMAVTFDFRVGDLEARITRSTEATGQTDVLLQRRVNGEYETFGEGADQVRAVNKAAVDLVGLNYEAFTRSVVLPQGKFARFLVGDQATRRKILSELLGLELFEKMAVRANEIAREAKGAADAIEKQLVSSYSEVTDEQRDELRGAERAAAVRVDAMGRVHKEVAAMRDAARTLDSAVERVAGCGRTIAHLLARFDAHLGVLQTAAVRLRAAHESVGEAKIEVEKAADAVDGARADLMKAEQRWGTRDQLTALREKVERYVDAVAEAAATTSSLRIASDRFTAATARAAVAEKLLREAEKVANESSAAVATMERRYDEAHRHDLVGTLMAGVNPGEPCPVCERPLESVPETDDEAFTRARADLERAKSHLHAAAGARVEAEKDHILAVTAVETASGEKARCERELRRRSAARQRLHDDIAVAFSGPVPDEPSDEIDRRLLELEDLSAALDEATARLATADNALRDRESAVERARNEIDRIRVAIEQCSVDAAIAEARQAGATAGAPVSEDVPEEPAEVERYATTIAGVLREVDGSLERRLRDLSRDKSELEKRALTLLPEDAVPADSIDDAVEAAAECLRRAREESALTRAALERLEDELTKKHELEAEGTARRQEHELYRSLGMELRKDRIVDYLQAEALRALAHFASERLRDLSAGRYQLAFEDEGFYVVDGWNGDERRRVSTLSGGETFLASLALALALSEQVQLLAVTERQRLESLFLDEGFGSLDAETLEVVVAAIEQLGGEDRLVGVITHVTEIAEQMPARIEVVKSPRGSRLVRAR